MAQNYDGRGIRWICSIHFPFVSLKFQFPLVESFRIPNRHILLDGSIDCRSLDHRFPQVRIWPIFRIILLLTNCIFFPISRYKPIIIAIGVLGIMTYAMLLWTTSLFWSQMIQVSYAAYTSCEVAYFTYIFAKVSKEHYLAVSSHTRAALLAGRCLSGVIGQLLMQTQLMDIRELNYITFGAQIAALGIAFILPSAKTSIYFNRADSEDRSIAEPWMKMVSAFDVISMHLRQAYSNHHVVLWSIWYSFAVCGYFQMINYIQMLWTAIDDDPAVS